MNKTISYTQCSLHSGPRRYKAWIPTYLAVKGKTIQFKREDGTWGHNWEIVSTGTTLLDELASQLNQRHKIFKDKIR